MLHVGTSKNLTAPLYSKTRKSEKQFYEKKMQKR